MRAAAPVEEWDRVHAVNARGPFLCSRAVLPSIVAAGGHIITIASVAGLAAFPGRCAYTASKGAAVACGPVTTVAGVLVTTVAGAGRAVAEIAGAGGRAMAVTARILSPRGELRVPFHPPRGLAGPALFA